MCFELPEDTHAESPREGNNDKALISPRGKQCKSISIIVLVILVMWVHRDSDQKLTALQIIVVKIMTAPAAQAENIGYFISFSQKGSFEMSSEITRPAFTSLSKPCTEIKASKSLQSGATVPGVL